MGTFNAKPSAYVAGQWIPDNQANECFGCQEEFSVTLRRHHCRCCGEVFCADCWGTQVNLPADYGYDGAVKLCTVCASMFEGSLRFLRMARRIVVTRHANLPHQLANTAATPQGSSTTFGRELSSTGGGSVVQTDRSIIVTGSSRGLEAQLHHTVSQAAINTPPLCRDNMRKGAFEVFFLKLVHWRPFDNITHLQFSISLRAASERDSSNFRVKNDANDPNVRLCGGKVVIDKNETQYSQCGAPNQGAKSTHHTDPDEHAGTFRKRNSAMDNPNKDANNASEIAWNLPLDSILQATYDYHDEGDFISIETLQEVYRIQVADIFNPGEEGARQVRNHRDRMTASGRETFDEIYQGGSSMWAGSGLASRPEGPDIGFLSAFATQQPTNGATDEEQNEVVGGESPPTTLAPPTTTLSGRNLKFNEEDEVSDVVEGDNDDDRGNAPYSRPLKGTRYTINPEDTAKLYVEIQELLKMVRSRTADGSSTIGSSRKY